MEIAVVAGEQCRKELARPSHTINLSRAMMPAYQLDK